MLLMSSFNITIYLKHIEQFSKPKSKKPTNFRHSIKNCSITDFVKASFPKREPGNEVRLGAVWLTLVQF